MFALPVNDDMELIGALLGAIEGDILPLTRASVERGSKIFGAALLRKSDLAVVLAETNNERENPLWHGEIHAIKRYHEMPGDLRPDPKDLIFLSTHEPCSMCLSAITWAGFDNFYYLFSHEDSRDAFAIPHDLRILKEVFGLESGGYRARNAFWVGQGLRAMMSRLPPGERAGVSSRADDIASEYARLSAIYQARKGGASIPLA